MRPAIVTITLCACIGACRPQMNADKPGHTHRHTHAQGEGVEHSHHHGAEPRRDGSDDRNVIQAARVVAATAHAPEFIQHASGVEIIEDIGAFGSKVGVETQEGYFGPLLFGSELRAFFIVLRPGQFLAEHPHPTESMVYTVSGKWVLCSEGKRHVMKPGTLFHFGDDKPTGWEAPFSEEAHLLIVKKKNSPEQHYQSYMAGLARMQARAAKERASGVPFWFHELDADHPARHFAAQVNPDFEELLTALRERDGVERPR